MGLYKSTVPALPQKFSSVLSQNLLEWESSWYDVACAMGSPEAVTRLSYLSTSVSSPLYTSQERRFLYIRWFSESFLSNTSHGTVVYGEPIEITCEFWLMPTEWPKRSLYWLPYPIQSLELPNESRSLIGLISWTQLNTPLSFSNTYTLPPDPGGIWNSYASDLAHSWPTPLVTKSNTLFVIK